MLGNISAKETQSLAQDQGLDLIEIYPNADPPVCRIMDFGKFRYDESRKKRQARKHQHSHALKEIKFHVNVGDHDYETKVNHLQAFLTKGHKVKITLTFRGRENAHRELGFDLVNRVIKDCEQLSVVDMPPKMVGRNLTAVLGIRSGKSSR